MAIFRNLGQPPKQTLIILRTKKAVNIILTWLDTLWYIKIKRGCSSDGRAHDWQS